MEIKGNSFEEIEQLGKSFDERIAQTIELIRSQGYEFDTTEWLTIRGYSKKYGIPENTLNDWISTGVIPADAVEDLPEIRNLRIIKDHQYQ
jgi:hypothetical protein